MPMPHFRYGRFVLEYGEANILGLIETYLLDIYRTMLIRKGDIVVDLGAGIGDYAILAASRGAVVLAIEPNRQDFELMKKNIITNGMNIIPINMGIADKAGTETIAFAGRTYSFQVDTLPQVLKQHGITKIDVLKLDIEGYETRVLGSIVDILKNVRIIPIELHGTKIEVDKLLLPAGFKFIPLTKGHIYRRAIMLLLTNPKILRWALRHRRSNKTPDIVSEGSGLIVGIYRR